MKIETLDKISIIFVLPFALLIAGLMILLFLSPILLIISGEIIPGTLGLIFEMAVIGHFMIEKITKDKKK